MVAIDDSQQHKSVWWWWLTVRVARWILALHQRFSSKMWCKTWARFHHVHDQNLRNSVDLLKSLNTAYNRDNFWAMRHRLYWSGNIDDCTCTGPFKNTWLCCTSLAIYSPLTFGLCPNIDLPIMFPTKENCSNQALLKHCLRNESKYAL